MVRRICSRFRFLLQKFGRKQEGSVAIIFALAWIPILIAAGSAIDFSRAIHFRTALQGELDAAVLAGAKDGSSSWTTVAKAAFNGNVTAKFGTPSTPAFKQTSSDSYTGAASGQVPTVMLGIIHIPYISVTVRATAVAAAADDSCILTLDHGQPPSHTSLSLNGAPVVNLSGCSIRSNTAIDCNGHDGAATKAIAAGAAGDCTHPRSNAPVVPDIYSSLASNITTQCGGARPGVTWTPGSLPLGAGIKTVDRGSYTEYHICGNLTLSGTGDLFGTSSTSDSVIIVENGSLTITNGSSISTARTAIVMTGDNSSPANINFPTGNGQSATLSLSAPTASSDPWRGVALFQDPKLTNNVDDRWGPGATLNADGLVYLGNANVVTDGNTGSGNSRCSKFVMNSFITNGAVDLNLDQDAGACAGLGLKQWDGIYVRLTE